MKSLEVSEEKANQRVEEFKREMKTLTVKLKEAEQRAEHAEKHVKRLQKEVDRLEGKRCLHISLNRKETLQMFTNLRFFLNNLCKYFLCYAFLIILKQQK